jgi:hypothetical protein
MTDTNLPANEARRTAEAILKRDRRRIRTLAVLTVGLWVIAALLIVTVYLPLGGRMKQYANSVAAENPEMLEQLRVDRAFDKPAPPVPADQVPATLARVQREHWVLTKFLFGQWIVGAIIMGLALAAGILASAATVMLALTIRRTTLRQVTASLAEISEQLRLLREQRGGAA